MANRTWGRDLGIGGDYNDAANWVTAAVPGAGDHVRIPYGSQDAITLSLNASAVAIGDFIVESGAPAIGHAPATATGLGAPVYLQIDPDRFVFDGTADSFIDLGTAAIAPQIDGTSTPSTGERGLYLLGTAMTTLAINGGHVGVAWAMGEVSTATTIAVDGSDTTAWLGAGITLTNFTQQNGTSVVLCSHTTANIHRGTVTTKGAATITTCNVYGGLFIPNSTGTITTLNVYGGIVDLTRSAAARTITTLNLYPAGAVYYDPTVATVTTFSPKQPIAISTSRVS